MVDPYLRFWLRFVASGGVEEVDKGRGDLLLDRIERGLADVPRSRDRAAGEASVERLLPDGRFGDARYVGGYWTRTNIPEVDLVGAAEREPARGVVVGSIKWRERGVFSVRDTRSP